MSTGALRRSEVEYRAMYAALTAALPASGCVIRPTSSAVKDDAPMPLTRALNSRWMPEQARQTKVPKVRFTCVGDCFFVCVMVYMMCCV